MKLTSPFSIIKNAISDLKRVPKEKKEKVKSNKTEYRRRTQRGNWHNPVDTPLFYWYN